MKFSLGRMAAIFFIFLLILTVWYMYELNEGSRKQNVLLSEEKKALEKRISDLYADKKSLESDIEGFNKERAALQDKIVLYENKARETTAGYEARLKEMALVMEGLKAAASEKEGQLAERKQDIEALRKKIQDYESDIAELTRGMAQAPAAAGNIETDRAVNLEPITVTSQGKKESVQVLEINREYGFVVMNIGAAHGIRKGDCLYVFRNRNLLGRVVVEKVGDECSVAKVPYKSLADSIKKGDLVSY